MHTYLFPKHSEEEVHEDSVLARVLLTQRVDGLHHYHLQQREAREKGFCLTRQEKTVEFVSSVLVPSLETMVLPLLIQQMQSQEVKS